MKFSSLYNNTPVQRVILRHFKFVLYFTTDSLQFRAINIRLGTETPLRDMKGQEKTVFKTVISDY